ncbi:MAG TPA: hypothetical protein DCP25_01340 [Chloroflexi bacterium]|nr:hypothetical protein [Chloroflexota bacterium]
MAFAVEAAEFTERDARVGVRAIDRVAGLAAMLFGLHEPDLDRATHVRLEGIALDAREQLAEQRGVHPVGLVIACSRVAHEVEQVDDPSARLPGVSHERMPFGQPAHCHVAAVARDLFRGDRAALLGDVEERLEEDASLRASLREPTGLVGARQGIEHGLDRWDAAGVLAGDRVDAPEHADQMEQRLGHERVTELEREQLLVLEPGAGGLLGVDVVLCDAEVDPLVEDAGCFLVRERYDASHEVAARHLIGAERDQLIEQQDRKTPLLLLGFR